MPIAITPLLTGQGTSDTFLLFLASRDGKDKIAQLLIEKGARISLKDNFGRIPLHQSAIEGKPHYRY